MEEVGYNSPKMGQVGPIRGMGRCTVAGGSGMIPVATGLLHIRTLVTVARGAVAGQRTLAS
jgi:hypothetical protein